MNRIRRFFRLFSSANPGAKRVYGRLGENYVARILSPLGYHLFFNRILPHPGMPGRYIESDVIVYGDMCIFCVEVKRYKGRVFRVGGSVVQESHRGFYKRRGGVYEARRMKDPMSQSKFFTKSLRKYLISKNEKFKLVKFIPVVAFVEEADISSVYSFEEGIIYASELPEFINSRLENSEEHEWIINELESLKGFDEVVNTDGVSILGFIVGEGFECLCDGGVYSTKYEDIRCIEVDPGGLFSSCDRVKVVRRNGKVDEICCRDGFVEMDVFGSKQKHYIRNTRYVGVNSRV